MCSRIRNLVKGTVQKLENDADQDICKQAAAFKDIMQDQVRSEHPKATNVQSECQSISSKPQAAWHQEGQILLEWALEGPLL